MIRRIRAYLHERAIERRIETLLEERERLSVGLAEPPAHVWPCGGVGLWLRLQHERIDQIDLAVAELEGWDDAVLAAYEERLTGVVVLQ